MTFSSSYGNHFSSANQSWYLEEIPEFDSNETTIPLLNLLGYTPNSIDANHLEYLLIGQHPRLLYEEGTSDKTIRNRTSAIYTTVRDVLKEHGLITIVESNSQGSPVQYSIVGIDEQLKPWQGAQDLIFLLELAGYRRHPFHQIYKIMSSLNEVEGKLDSLLYAPNDRLLSLESISSIHSIWDFPSSRDIRRLSISGTLSIFSPLLTISADLSSELQNVYRDKQFPEVIEPSDIRSRQIFGENFHRNLAFLSGQMLWHVEFKDWVCLGLFQGVCKNSIPVFVKKSYFDKEKIKGNFQNRYTVNARVVGRLVELDLNRDNLINIFGQILDGTDISVDEIREKSRFMALVVDGNNSTEITCYENPGYLDGDLWCLMRRRQEGLCSMLSLACKTGVNISSERMQLIVDRFQNNITQFIQDRPGYEVIVKSTSLLQQ